MNQKLLIIADINQRASIATLRTLDNKKNLFIGFGKKRLKNQICFSSYTYNKPVFYNSNNKQDFISSLIEIRKKIGEYVLLPFGEEILRWAISKKEELVKEGIIIPTVDIKEYELISNKKSFTELCNKFGLDVPSVLKINKEKFDRRFVIKPIKFSNNPRALKIPMLVENKKSFQKMLALDIDLELHFIQEYISGPSIYYNALYKNGIKKLFFIQFNICQQPGGKSVIKATPSELPKEIISKIDEMMNSLKWDGVIMIEFKKSIDTNNYYAIEANPRFWGPLQLAIDNGINFPKALIEEEIEKNLPRKNIGYLWTAGYFLGIYYKLFTRTKFQKFNYDKKSKVKYKDVWLRKDTYKFFCIEPIFIMITSVKDIIKKIKKI